MTTLSKAIEIALLAHKEQKDKSGAEYILHPLRVMARGNTEVENPRTGEKGSVNLLAIKGFFYPGEM